MDSINLKHPDSAKMSLEDVHQACRVCLSKENNMNMTDLAYENESMLDIFVRCTTVALEPNEGLTTFLCGKCIKFLMQVQDFRLKALKSNSKLLYLKGLAETKLQPTVPIVIEDDDDDVETIKTEESTNSPEEPVQEKTIYATLQNVVPNFVVAATSFENNIVHTTTPESMCLVYEDEENYYVENKESADTSEVNDKENVVLKFEAEEVTTTEVITEDNQEIQEREKTKDIPDMKKMQIVQVCKICRQVFTTVRELNKHFNCYHKIDLMLLKCKQV